MDAKTFEIQESKCLAEKHKDDMFGNLGKPNFEKLKSAVNIFYLIEDIQISIVLALMAVGCVLVLTLTDSLHYIGLSVLFSATLLDFMPNSLLKLSLYAVPLVYVILKVIYLWFYFKKFRFRFEEGFFYVRKGVIGSAHRLLPYENIQDIHVVQGVIERLLGISSVIIFTATTSAGSEWIPGLSPAGAERLKTELFKKVKEVKYVTD